MWIPVQKLLSNACTLLVPMLNPALVEASGSFRVKLHEASHMLGLARTADGQ